MSDFLVLFDEAQFDSIVENILETWSIPDIRHISFGTGDQAQILWNDYMQGFNPSTGMWASAASEDVADLSSSHHILLEFDKIDLDDDWTAIEDGGAGEVTAALQDEMYGVVLFTTGAVAFNSDEYQFNGESWDPLSENYLWFETRIRAQDVFDSAIFIGLLESSGNDCYDDIVAAPAVRDGMYFYSVDGVATIDGYCRNELVASAGGAPAGLANNTWIRLGFIYDGILGSVSFYADGVLIGTVTTDLPDENLTIVMCIVSGALMGGTVAMDVDYIKVSTVRS